MNYKHIMIDLETYGTKPGAAIRSIGAVEFNPYTLRDYGREFYQNICDDSCRQLGLDFDAETIKWWEEQGEKAQAALQDDKIPIKEVADAFRDWVQEGHGVFIWCQGAAFDAVLWEAVCERLGVKEPWQFTNVRDTRTIYQVGKINTKAIKREGIYHHALHDAKHQALCVQSAFKKIGWIDYG